jgi:hypothetical protein
VVHALIVAKEMNPHLIVFVLAIFCLCGCRREPLGTRTALAPAVAIESAVNYYLTEYGSMPYPGASDATILTSTDTELLHVLLGLEDEMNKRSIKFLIVREGKENRNGLIYTDDSRSVVGLFDPWGSGYNVRLDLDSDQKIDARGETLNNRRVAVWSNGPDRKSGTKDDVKTW